MVPASCKKRIRTGWCLLALLTGLSLRLSLPARALPGQTDAAPRKLVEAALFLELGVKAPAPEQTSPAPEETAEVTEPTGDRTGRRVAAPYTSPGVGADDPGGPSVGADDPGGPQKAPAQETLPAQELVFLASEAQALKLRGNCSYKPDVAALLLSPTELSPDTAVLIVHTHSSEAYTPSSGCEYEPSGDYRTLEPDRSVIAVGEALAEELRDRGVRVIHDVSCNDYPSYNSSYANARERIQAQLDAHPDIGLVLDLHRDALAQPVREEAVLDGEICAPMMLVVGTDEGGLEHPRWQQNLSCALKLQALVNRSCPDLMKPISLRRERFNGDLTPGSLIVEVGSTENTLPEARLAVRALAEAVAKLLGVRN